MDVAHHDQRTRAIRTGVRTCTVLPNRTPGVALAQALADYPGMQLWSELRALLPHDAAVRVYEAAAQLYRDTRS